RFRRRHLFTRQAAQRQASLGKSRRRTRRRRRLLQGAQPRVRGAAQVAIRQHLRHLREGSPPAGRSRASLSQQARHAASQRSLAATWDNLSSARKEIAAQQNQLQKSQAELDAANKTAAAAMASLNKIAQVKEEQRGTVITLD